jgi:hypothetical protein
MFDAFHGRFRTKTALGNFGGRFIMPVVSRFRQNPPAISMPNSGIGEMADV